MRYQTPSHKRCEAEVTFSQIGYFIMIQILVVCWRFSDSKGAIRLIGGTFESFKDVISIKADMGYAQH